MIVDGDLLISLSGEDIPEREYLKVTAKKLIDDLDKNALTAKETYLNQYVEVSGLLETIDSSGKYISVTPDKYSFSSIHCTIKSKDILEKIKKMSSGSKITVYGKITDIGEFLGYTMTIQDVK